MNTWFEREEDMLCEQLNNGEITRKQFDEEMRQLRDAFRAEAEKAAEDAYNDAMGSW